MILLWANGYIAQPNISVIISRSGDKYQIHHVFHNTFPSFRFPGGDYVPEIKANDIISGKKDKFTYSCNIPMVVLEIFKRNEFNAEIYS